MESNVFLPMKYLFIEFPVGIYCILNYEPLNYEPASLITQLVKNLPAMQETLVWFLGLEDPLEKA